MTTSTFTQLHSAHKSNNSISHKIEPAAIQSSYLTKIWIWIKKLFGAAQIFKICNVARSILKTAGKRLSHSLERVHTPFRVKKPTLRGIDNLNDLDKPFLIPVITQEAKAILATESPLKAAVIECAWDSHSTRIKGSLAIWRASFPHATTANISDRTDLTDADFAHLEGILKLNMSGCKQPTITNAAFAHLTGIHVLNMSHCNQPTITDAAFAHLRGIHTLDMSWCGQITDAAFANLTGIHTLRMSACQQLTISDAAFAHLDGIHTLNMWSCNQPTITDAAFAHLKGIHTLNMFCCNQLGITDAAFAHLRGIHTLNMNGCSQPAITDEAFAHLRGIHTLSAHNCPQLTIHNAADVRALFPIVEG